MQVTDECDFALPVEVANHALDVPIDWVQSLRRYLPPSVQILPSKRAPVVAIDDSIWIQHWHDLKHEILSKSLRLGRITD